MEAKRRLAIQPLANMHGSYVAFLDADDAYLPNHLDVAVAYLQTNQSVGVYTWMACILTRMGGR